MAAAGPEVVPAAGRGGDPGWLQGLFGQGIGIDGGDFIWLERAALVAYVLVVAFASALPRRLLWGGIALIVGAFTLAPPLLSLDVFSYISYARLEGLHGLDPYEFAPSSVPADGALAFVEDYRDKVSVYGPLFTVACLPLAQLGVAGALWTLKAVAGASVLAIALLVSRLAALRGSEPAAAAALVALNPLVLVHVVGGAHNDALMALLLTAGVGAVLADRQTAAGIGLIGAAGVKASALLTLPFAVVGSDRRGRLVAGLAIGAALLGAVGLLAFGSSVDESLKVVGQGQDTASRASLPATISRELGLGIDGVRAACLGLFAAAFAGLLAWTWHGADWVRAAGWAAIALLATTAYVTPWYVIWALPLVAIGRDRSLVAASVAVSAFLLIHQVPGLGG